MNEVRNHVHAVIAIAAGVSGLCPAQGQETGKVMIDVADCIKLEAPEARLACYESRVAAVFGERAARAAVARPAAPAPVAAVEAPPPATNVEPAPPTGSAAPVRAAPREEEAAAAESQAANDMVSRVKELREVVPNTLQITLENGQVWRQTVSKHYGLRPGQQVRIYGTRWGSASRLSADEINGYIQVERVR